MLPDRISIKEVIRLASCYEFCGTMLLYLLQAVNGDTASVDSNRLIINDGPTYNARSFPFLQNIYPQNENAEGRIVTG